MPGRAATPLMGCKAWVLPVLILIGLTVGACGSARPVATRFVSGLNQPRGLVIDDTGNLFVAETGLREAVAAGKQSADTNHSGRVIRISPQRQMTPVVDGLPYTYYKTTGDVGTADIVLFKDGLYVLTGEGYDDALSRKVLRVTPDGTIHPIADILTFALGMATGVEQVIGSVTSNPYAMVAAPDGSTLYVTDGASGRILRVGFDGKISVFAEFPGMPPLTGLAFDSNGLLYVAQFSLWPHTPGSGEIWTADAGGDLVRIASGLTMPINLEFDAAGALYVLEFADGRQPEHPYAPRSGRLLRIEKDGTHSVLLERLNYPTGLTFSASGDLYLTVGGAFTTAGQGTILKIRCHMLDAELSCP